MDRFRPNIVVSAQRPWEEDEWPALQGPDGIHLDVTRPCSRCAVPNNDQTTGVPESVGNLQVLSKRRLFKNYLGRPGAFFGVQALVTGCEGKRLQVGDELRPTEQSPGLPAPPRFLK